eukprot:PhF_6_TR4510/c0_g2_i1/m.6279
MTPPMHTCPSLSGYKRIEIDVQSLQWNVSLPYPDYQTFVLSKHLCGTYMDTMFQSMFEQSFRPAGVLIAPCCYHKGSAHRFAEISSVMSHSDWNMGDVEQARKLVSWTDEIYKKNLWRYDIGRLFERLFDEGRMLYLQKAFKYEAILAKTFVEHAVTPRNTLIEGY